MTFAAAAGVACLPALAQADTSTTWSFIGSSDWDNAVHWSNGVPSTFEEDVYIISSNNSRLDNTVGYDYSGPAITLGAINISNNRGGNDLLSITAAGLMLSTVGVEYIGGYQGSTGNGKGEIMQSAGTNSGANGVYIGTNLGDTGSYFLSGTGSLSVQSERIGEGGFGVFNQSGGTNTTPELDVGYAGGSSGTYTLSSGTLVSSLEEIVGENGTGEIDQTGGTNTVATEFDIGAYNIGLGIGVGTYLLSGGSAVLSSTSDGVYIGGESFYGPGGTGFLTVSNTGQMSIGRYLTIDHGAVSATNEIFGGGSAANATIVVGPSNNGNVADVQQSGGTNTVGGELDVGATVGSTGTYSLSGGTVTVNGNAYIGGSRSGAGGTGTVVFNNTSQGTIAGVFTLFNGKLSTANAECIGGTPTTIANLVVGPGPNGVGVFTQTGGTNADGFDLFLGKAPGDNGAYTLTGTGVLTASTEWIGDGGTGAFIQTSGSNAAVNVYTGNQTSSTGSYSLSGTGTLTASNEWVGNAGTGNFNQSGGTNTVSGTVVGLLIGEETGSTGTYTLSNGSLAVDAIGEYVGNQGEGIFNQSGGSNTAYAALSLGTNPGGTGSYVLTNGVLEVHGDAYVGGESYGSGGTGTLAVSNSGQMSVDTALYLFNGAVSATNEIIGGGSANAATIVVGPDLAGGSGSFVQSGGTNTVGNELDLAYSSGSTGTFTLSGGTTNVNGNAYIGGSSSGAGGTGSLTLSNSGQMNVTGSLTIYNGTVNAGNEYIGGGTATSASIVVGTGAGGMVDQSGGINFPNSLYLAENAGSTGTYTLSGAGAIACLNSEWIGYGGTGTFTQTAGSNVMDFLLLGENAGSGGTYTLSGAAGLTAFADEVIGQSGTGTFAQNGGINNAESSLFLGDGTGSTGTYTLTAGTLFASSPGEYVGDLGGTGTFIQSGGGNTLNSGAAIYVGYAGSGTYNLSGTGTLSMTNSNEYVGYGDLADGYSAIGAFIQSGGLNTLKITGGNTASLYLGYNADATGSYTLSGTGSLSEVQYEYVGYRGIGMFNQSGGTNHCTNLSIGSVVGSDGSYTLSGGTLTVNGIAYIGGTNPSAGGTGTLTVSNSGQLNVTNSLTIFKNGQVNINGGTSTVGSVSIATGGVVNINSTLHINYGAQPYDQIASIKAAIATGAAYNGSSATWTGTGITSTMAALSVTNPLMFAGKTYVVGYLDGDNATDNQYGTVPANQIIVKYTIAGDAFLESSVGFHDLLVVAQDYQLTGMDYAQGNFTYNPSGSVGFADLLDVAQSYGQSFNLSGATDGGETVQPLTWQSPSNVTAVPEPTSVMLAVGAAGFLASRRRISIRHQKS